MYAGGRSAKAELCEWNGIALGADARIVLLADDRDRAAEAIAASMAEVARLEAIFSLFIESSELSLLNRTKTLSRPSMDLRRLLQLCRTVHSATEGLFDPTIQPLWRFYFDWFSGPGRNALPPPETITELTARTGFHHAAISETGVSLPGGVELSFNGVAQGYITDCVAQVLRGLGWTHVLIDIGEVRALGGRPGGLPWQVRIRESGESVPLRNRALAVSAGGALVFSPEHQLTHILNPKTGLSPQYWRYLAVEHASAAVADALSTGFYLADAAGIARAAPRFSPVKVLAEDGGGRSFSWAV
jgi:thiamine biosynthesis lipoprotein